MKSHKAAKSHFGKSKLPKYIRENIKHPVLRQAWLLELAAVGQRIDQTKGLA